ncbi:MAG TPA: hypothetical protein VIZ61_09215, partial [Solirubrobacterales bacterium]
MNVPGPKLILSPQQAKSVAEQAKRCSHVEVEESRAGYLKVRSFDLEGEPIDERWIDSDRFYGTTRTFAGTIHQVTDPRGPETETG